MEEKNNGKIIRKGRRLSYLLRHDRAYAFDEHGWREVKDLVANHGYTIEELDEIVDTNNKQRFEYNADKTAIRARQGHSVKVDVELLERIPPKTLYHGTAHHFLESIMEQGIVKSNRLHVHLSPTADIAVNVGKRHGRPVVLEIDAGKMSADGCKFYISNNGVWLTDYVAPQYFTIKVLET